MQTRRKFIAGAGAGLVLAAALTGCSSKASGDGAGSGSSTDGTLKTDFGVTEDTITLGALTDASGAFKVNGLGTVNGVKAWADEVNQAGGICDRQIVLDIQDHGYKPDNALPLYDQMKSNVVGFAHLLGSPVLAALKSKIIADQIVTVPGAWASVSLDNDYVLELGATYDVEMINALDYLMYSGAVAKGDKVGHIYVDSDLGQNGLLGSEHYAKEHGLTIVGTAITASDTDMTATITKMKSEGVSAILLSAAPPATGSAVLQATEQGLDVPLVGSSPSFALPLLKDSATAAAMQQHYRLMASFAPFGADLPKAAELATAYAAATSDPPSRDATGGYINGLAWQAILETACENGDLTRAGILAAREQIDDLDTFGLSGELDLAAKGAPTTRKTFVLRVDPTAPDGLAIEEDLAVSDAAKSYQAPFEK